MQQIVKERVQNNSLPRLLIFILVITLLRIGILVFNIWPVNGDETQYWSWAKHIAWGYYSKPPMLAWLIALTTKFFGDGIAAMRLAAPLTHSVTTVMIYFIARDLYSNSKPERFRDCRQFATPIIVELTTVPVAFWAAIIYLLAPGVSFSSTIISTDPPLLMFWSIAFYCFMHALQTDSYKWWCGVGVALGFAMLSKYAAIFFMISIAFYFLIEKQQRSQLYKPGIYLALFIVLAILFPNFVWNSQHGFVSVMAVKDNADLQSSWFHPAELLNFLLAQFVLINPIIFSLLLLFIVQSKVWRDANARFLLAFIVPIFTVMFVEALLVRAHANWTAPMYIAAAILVSKELVQRNKQYLLIAALILNLFAIVAIINVQSIVRTLGVHIHQPTTIVNWQGIGKEINELHKYYPTAKILVDSRMLLTEVMYFGQIELTNTFKWNPQHQLRGQYDLVTHLNGEIGNNFLLFTYNPTPVAIMQRFKKVQPLTALQLKSLDGRLLPLYVFYLQGFKGYA